MIEPKPDGNHPDEIIYLTQGFLQFSDTFLRAYGHPLLLKVAENINGEDFVPFTEGYFITVSYTLLTLPTILLV